MSATSIPTVDPSDLERAYEVRRTTPTDHAISIDIFSQVCKPNADLEAVLRRVKVLFMLANFSPQAAKTRLSPWLRPEGVWTAPAFRAASKFPMDWYANNSMFPSLEELEAFIQELKKEGWE
jgi:hypothetical protein